MKGTCEQMDREYERGVFKRVKLEGSGDANNNGGRRDIWEGTWSVKTGQASPKHLRRLQWLDKVCASTLAVPTLLLAMRALKWNTKLSPNEETTVASTGSEAS